MMLYIAIFLNLQFLLSPASASFLTPSIIVASNNDNIAVRSSYLGRKQQQQNNGHWRTTTALGKKNKKTCYYNTNDSDNTNEIVEEVRSARRFRQSGITVGITFFASAVFIGSLNDIIDPILILQMTLFASICFVINTLSYNQYRSSLLQQSTNDDANIFQIRESLIPNAGLGLFTTRSISEGMCLLEYDGENLTEEEYFARYPDGQGKYVACIAERVPFLLPFDTRLSEPIYIDGIDPSSGMARYMNSKKDDANVYWKKQRWFGGKMYFYALRDIQVDEELCFDYGNSYWDAVK